MPPSVSSMNECIALVTGASRGLGRVLAAGLAREGYHLVIGGRNSAALAAAVPSAAGAGRVTAVPGT